ncbi:MAG: amidohydrolase family protein [Cupriavidus sp.]|nr:MAG: amidohydrolase family protein [Cupriavidus sp.]
MVIAPPTDRSARRKTRPFAGRSREHFATGACTCCSPAVQAILQRVMNAGLASPESGVPLSDVTPHIENHPLAHDTLAASVRQPVLFSNVRLFDGIKLEIQTGLNVLVEGDRISAILGSAEKVADAREIDGRGALLMPGLIDAHWHSTLCAIPQMVAMTADPGYIHLVSAREAGRTLLRGFTTIRDAGGPSFALKRAVDEGITVGPRIFPSGAMISQTSGHGDFRLRGEIPRPPGGSLSHAESLGAAMIADGETEVLRRVREQLMLGATQIKLMAGGGVTSAYDPLDSLQYTDKELRAGVAAASDWGTYVMVHVYTSGGIQRAVRAGVRSIEHGQLADEETARIMAGEGVWWSLQPFFGDEDANAHDAAGHAKQRLVAEGTARAYELARKHNIKTAWGTDILFSPANLPNHARQLAKLTRFYAPLELLRMATGSNGELLKMSGSRNTYGGDVGVITPGALADMLLVEGDPTKDLDFLTDADNLLVIMKGGVRVKDILPAV